jgi:hypothetical protein
LDDLVFALVLDRVNDRDYSDPFVYFLSWTCFKNRAMCFGQHLAAAGRSIGRRFAHDLFTLVCLPYEAFYSLGAILHTLWRMLVTHKRLLNGVRQATRKGRTGLTAVCRTMWFAPFSRSPW